MTNSNGFYKMDYADSVLSEPTLLYAPNFVLNKDYELRIEQKDAYNYPIDGWYYFDNVIEAENFFINTGE